MIERIISLPTKIYSADFKIWFKNVLKSTCRNKITDVVKNKMVENKIKFRGFEVDHKIIWERGNNNEIRKIML